jgi:predicted phage terminase large subunit-like protein
MRHVENPKYRAVIFRRTYPELKQPGGIWQESLGLYGKLGGMPNLSDLIWTWPSGAEIRMSHLQHETDVLGWQGARLDFVGYEEMSHFTKEQIWYLFSRLGTTSGIAPVIRGTTNPDPDAHVAELVDWYIGDSGLAIPERSGVLRWFARAEDQLVWGESPDALKELGVEPRSFTFVHASLDDNPALTTANPHYRANLQALPHVQRERLLNGNWHVRPAAGLVFHRDWFPIVPDVPEHMFKQVRFWDLAATEGGGDYTVGIEMAEIPGKGYVVLDMVRGQWSSNRRDMQIRATAEADGGGVRVFLEQEPGSAGKDRAVAHKALLSGYAVHSLPSTGDKATRAEPASAQAEAGRIKLLAGPWNEAFLREVHGFPDAIHDDIVDAFAGAFNAIRRTTVTTGGGYRVH